jgi:predicted TPR repeat methyltransferase
MAQKAADLYLAQRDTDKAIENWARITNLAPENALAHSRLAQVHEKLGHNQQAVTEYLAVASLLQAVAMRIRSRNSLVKLLS